MIELVHHNMRSPIQCGNHNPFETALSSITGLENDFKRGRSGLQKKREMPIVVEIGNEQTIISSDLKAAPIEILVPKTGILDFRP